MPLGGPAIASLGIFQFLWVWNDMLVALIFADSESPPITVALQQQVRQFGNNIDVLAPGAFVSMVIPLAVFFAFQRQFVSGVMALGGLLGLLPANPHSTLVRERAYPSAYTTLEYGSPRNDVYHRTGPADVARLRETLGIPAGATALLYAPVSRDYRRVQRPTLDLERLVRVLGPQFVILARAPRPAGPGGRGRAPHPRIIDVSAHRSVETLALASDALLTHYASLMFDYVNLDRPVVLHLDDIEAYEAARGTYFDITAFPPGVVARSQDELFDIFATDHWRGSRSGQLRAAFRARFCPYDDGYAAERVVRRVFLGETDGLPLPVPFGPPDARGPARAGRGPGRPSGADPDGRPGGISVPGTRTAPPSGAGSPVRRTAGRLSGPARPSRRAAGGCR
ncbi:hypothetical protein SBADM41S_10172 [Streptomyces badius]